VPHDVTDNGQVLSLLRRKYPDAAFLALGQTIWWDEPMKAVLRRALDTGGLGGDVVAGVHDTDYFARVGVRLPGQARFELLPHNDGSTRDLWSAAGEISRLFGSETPPTRAAFAEHGVSLKCIARCLGEDVRSLVDRETEAWGWRGLVYTGSRDLIARQVRMSEAGGALKALLRWGFSGTLETLEQNACAEQGRQIADQMLSWVDEVAGQYPSASLPEVYCRILPRLYALVLGAEPERVRVSCTSTLATLNLDTYRLPRFEFLDLFLNPATAAIARAAYDAAVAGSEIYPLEKFGLGAIPFDAVIPQVGRGTLRVTLRAVHVETRHPVRVRTTRPVRSVRDLAEILQREFGPDVVVVGKALALISMLAREFIFVFNEEGSMYVARTRRMNDFLRAHGVPVVAHPVLRVRYPTWDALGGVGVSFRLPDHLATAFGKRTVTADEFARGWREAVARQAALLTALRSVRRQRDLLRFLGERFSERWLDRLLAYDEAKRTLRRRRLAAEDVLARTRAAYAQLRDVRRRLLAAEAAKGEHFRTTHEWTLEERQRRADFDEQIDGLLRERRSLLDHIARLRSERRAIEREGDAAEARAQVLAIEAEAARERLRLVRDALLTRDSLTHTEHRPTAWWVPLVDPCGRWFNQIAEGTRFYIEPLVTESSLGEPT